MLNPNLSPKEVSELLRKHLSDHVENVKQYRFEFAGYEEADIEEDCAYLTEAVSLRDNLAEMVKLFSEFELFSEGDA